MITLVAVSECWAEDQTDWLGGGLPGQSCSEKSLPVEDWNFNFGFSHKGMMLGYTVAQPAQRFVGDEFRPETRTFEGCNIDPL